MNIAIIGSAGRRDDAALWNKELYERALNKTLQIIEEYKTLTTCIYSGGAAWADHIAVSLFLRKKIERLSLFLPAYFDLEKNCYISSSWKDPGSISNYYHNKFSTKIGLPKDASLRGISKAHQLGANLLVVPGFFDRNLSVGKAEIIIALTFGTNQGTFQNQDLGLTDPQKAGLKDGGTAHTWKHSCATTKIHLNLHTL